MPDEPELPDDDASILGTRDWPHAPPHRLAGAGVYFVTARSRGGHHLLDTPAKRDAFQSALFELATKYGWQLEAWAILSNHYHLAKLVALAIDWPWCSAAAFKKAVSPAWVKTIASFRYDQIAREDGQSTAGRSFSGSRDGGANAQERPLAS